MGSREQMDGVGDPKWFEEWVKNLMKHEPVEKTH
jgi:hypothetical protein